MPCILEPVQDLAPMFMNADDSQKPLLCHPLHLCRKPVCILVCPPPPPPFCHVADEMGAQVLMVHNLLSLMVSYIYEFSYIRFVDDYRTTTV